ncbi:MULTISPECIES: PBECR2 nuclease fold domain-containing protein [Pseudomonas]|uniref:PBECR2 nuclease fold domain-containing protein n=1 Tax=Pseudomonas TaxID=286 RepID=UPI0020C2E3A6|nr:MULTISPECIES: PBECR2 nuclease fold domain-containing protein [Pseudomonas]MDH1572963.1 PBECR2 nuclease fold domain-containing protein [Pseudomonas sp. GD03746]UTL81418.1 PBECR2 nuclease fold domain-containing protein [Pseudomonas putida]HEN8709965.1 hypothetical protein [Pseudomonas putida]HEN8719087.1 hypothetical protein [Pseudomonas putida]
MSPNNSTVRVAEKKGQNTWRDKLQPDLRTLVREMRNHPVEELAAAASHDAAMELAALHLGLSSTRTNSVAVTTPMGVIRIQRSCVRHIVEKRQDARERYVKVALDTLTGPFEVWEVAYTNGTNRLAFIGVYETKRQMLVVVTLHNGKMLWNFMQCDAKALNKHRHGKLLYKRYCVLSSKEKGHCHQWPCNHA